MGQNGRFRPKANLVFMRKVVLFSFFLVVLGVVGWDAYEHYESKRRTIEAERAVTKGKARAERSPGANISFREVACKGHEPGSPPRVAVSAWDKDVLTIKAPVCLNCGLHVGSVTTRVEGGTLWVTINPEIREVQVAPGVTKKVELPMCDCERSLDIRIRSLPIRDYVIRGIAAVEDCA